MLNINKVLVARDDSSCSGRALDEALVLVLETGAELHILHGDVLLGTLSVEPGDIPRELQEIRVRLEELNRARQSGDGFAPPKPVRIVEVTERALSPSAMICDYAAENDIDLIFIGTHGRTGMRRLLLGSVAEEVVRTAPCPVFTAHEADAVRSPDWRRGSILVPIDFSEQSAEALRYASDLAALYGSDLKLIHIVEELAQPGFYLADTFPGYGIEPDIEEQTVRDLRTFAKDVLGSVRGVHCQAFAGNAATGIVGFASTSEVGLIVVSTHGATGLQQLLMGSVAGKVVRHAPCPVLTLRPGPSCTVLASPPAEAQVVAVA